MIKRKINLRIWMLLEVLVSFCVLGYYRMFVLANYATHFRYLRWAFLTVIIIFLLLNINKNRVILDEFTKETMALTNRITVSVAYALFGFIFASTLTSNPLTSGYFIAGCIIFLSVVRAIIVFLIGKKGLQN